MKIVYLGEKQPRTEPKTACIKGFLGCRGEAFQRGLGLGGIMWPVLEASSGIGGLCFSCMVGVGAFFCHKSGSSGEVWSLGPGYWSYSGTDRV